MRCGVLARLENLRLQSPSPFQVITFAPGKLEIGGGWRNSNKIKRLHWHMLVPRRVWYSGLYFLEIIHEHFNGIDNYFIAYPLNTVLYALFISQVRSLMLTSSPAFSS